MSRFRCGYAAIIGEPNVGKSTLLNAILGTKLSIVTSRPQTTRRRLLGFHTTDTAQFVFIDTPGLIKPKYVLQESMVNAAYASIAECDLVLFLADAPKLLERDRVFPSGLDDILRHEGKPVIAALNKTDLMEDKTTLLPLIERFHTAFPFTDIVPLSALRDDGVAELLSVLERQLPLSPPMYPPDMLSDQPERFFVSEIIREKIFEQFRQEVPYATDVVIAEYTEKDDIDHIAADILVERESQKRILIGKQGSAIKSIGTAARADIEQFLGRHVFLELHVKVRDHWRDSEAWVRRLGYMS
jgi:GTP-binding protein Era